jgi:hypothetical protein
MIERNCVLRKEIKVERTVSQNHLSNQAGWRGWEGENEKVITVF